MPDMMDWQDRITEKLYSTQKKYVRHGTGEGVIYRMHNSDPNNKILWYFWEISLCTSAKQRNEISVVRRMDWDYWSLQQTNFIFDKNIFWNLIWVRLSKGKKSPTGLLSPEWIRICRVHNSHNVSTEILCLISRWGKNFHK